MNINRYNFLRWNDNNGVDPTLLPNFFIREVSTYMPVLVPGEELSFYINTKDGLDYDNPNTMVLKVIKEGFASDAIDLEIDTISVGVFNFYSTFTIPALANGIYYLQILQGDTVVLTSNAVRVMNSDYEKTTSYLKFRNTENYYGVRYGILDEFYQQIRIHITETQPDYEFEMDAYTSSITGKVRSSYSTSQQIHNLQTYFFDKDAHEAAAVLSTHSFISINGVQYGKKSGYKPEALGINGRSKGTFEVYDLEYASINKCG